MIVVHIIYMDTLQGSAWKFDQQDFNQAFVLQFEFVFTLYFKVLDLYLEIYFDNINPLSN